MPWTEPLLPEAVMSALVNILAMLGDTRRSPRWTTPRPAGPQLPGLSSPRPGAGAVPPDPGFRGLAAALATRFADGPAELRRALTGSTVRSRPRITGADSLACSAYGPAPRRGTPYRGTQTVNASFDRPSAAMTMPPSPPGVRRQDPLAWL